MSDNLREDREYVLLLSATSIRHIWQDHLRPIVHLVYRLLGFFFASHFQFLTLRCVIPVVCVTNGREENVVKQHN